MTHSLSFMSANYVARELNFNMTQGWMEGDAATQAWFQPLETFSRRFGMMLDEIVELGFESIDLWNAHLNPNWATEAHIAAARTALDERGLTVASLAIPITSDPEEREQLARLARALEVRIIGCGCSPELLTSQRAELIDFLEANDLVFGYENHPEKSSVEVLEKIGEPAGGRIGVAIDTGWFATNGYDAARAIRELGSRIVHVHMKDILTPQPGDGPTLKDMGHETCALGEGVVPIEACLAALHDIGYSGGISFEHEPESHPVNKDARLSLERLKAWMKQ